jgi:hypothetical protein
VTFDGAFEGRGVEAKVGEGVGASLNGVESAGGAADSGGLELRGVRRDGEGVEVDVFVDEVSFKEGGAE